MTSIVVRLFGEDLTASKSLEHLAVVGETTGKRMRKQFGDLPKYATEAAIGVAAGSTYLAAGFQTATTRLVTDAGETQKNLGMIREGVLGLAGKVGETPVELAKGLYTVESAGYHGAAGLSVLKAAAEGAADGGADLKTVSDALTTVLTDYNIPASKSAETTSKLVETVSRGKTTMEDLAESLHSVLPGAEAAHLGLGQVLGAMATMTGEGISADQASENLNHAILSLQNPSQVATKAMAAVGLSSFDVAKNLGKKGLTGTYDELTRAITSNMKGGAVVESVFNRSKLAAASADAELKAMPKSLQAVASEYLKGSVTQKEWTNTIKAQTPANANLLKQWTASQSAAHGFSDAIKSGQGPFATYAAQLSKMTGGQTGLQVALHLTGDHMSTFKDNVKAVSGATTEAGGNVKGYAAMQATLNQQLKDSEAGVAVVGTRIGTMLIPPIVTVLKWTQQFGGELATNQPLLYTLATVLGVVGGALVAMYVAQQVVNGVTAIAKVATVSWTAAQWLLNAALDANPIGLVVLAVGALIAIVVLLVTHWKDVCSFLQTTWAAVSKWFGDTLTDIGDWWTQTWNDVVSVFKTVLGVAVSIFEHWTLLGVIVSHWNQILSATKTAWGAVTSFIGGIPGKILGFFAGIGKWLYTAGMNLLQGLVNGIKADIGAVSSVVSGVANNVIGTFKNLLGIHSPSTVFTSLGQFLMQGLQNGIAGDSDKVKAAMTTVSNDVTAAFTKLADQRAAAQKRLDALDKQERAALLERPVLHRTANGKVTAAAQESYDREMKIWRNRLAGIRSNISDEQTLLNQITRASSKSTQTRLTSLLKTDTAQLTKLAAQRDSIATQLKTAQDNLTSALGTENDYASGVTSGVLGLGNITSVQGQTTTAEDGSQTTAAVTSSDILSSMQQQLQKAQQFASDIAQLQSEGLNQTAYKQLVDAFSQNGDLSAADALVSGGAGAVSQLNGLQAQLQTQATSLGTTTSQSLYQAGVNAAQGIVDGLQSQEDAIGAQMAKIGTDLATSFKKALGIHSPSTVMAGHGVNVVQGVIVGMRSQQAEARSTIAELFGGTGPQGPAAGRGRAGGGVSVGQINVQSGATAQEIVSELNWTARIYGR